VGIARRLWDQREELRAEYEDVHGTDQALGALMAEIHRSGRAMKVLAAMAVQALDFADLSADGLGGDVQKWLDESVMAQDTAETERDQTELGGEG
jgi:hypothetical protein